MRQQCDAIGVDRGNEALDFHVLGIQTAVDQLIPCGMNWLWQWTFTKTGDSLAANAGREEAWLSDAVDLEQFAKSRSWPKGWTEAVDINPPSRILDDDSPGFRQQAGHHAANYSTIAAVRFLARQSMNLLGRS